MNTVLALQKARNLIETGWCQMTGAKNAHGIGVFAHSQDAVQWCSDAAITRVTWPWDDNETEDLWKTTEECWDYLVRAIREQYGWDRSDELDVKIIQDWNDDPDRSKEEVVAVFTAAIELAKEG